MNQGLPHDMATDATLCCEHNSWLGCLLANNVGLRYIGSYLGRVRLDNLNKMYLHHVVVIICKSDHAAARLTTTLVLQHCCHACVSSA